MHIIHGIYHFGRKRVAIRRDFCFTCKGERTAALWQSSDWWYLFFVPLIPLGRRERWACGTCDMNPRYKPMSFVLNACLVLLPIFGAFSFFATKSVNGITVVFGFAWILLLLHVLGRGKDAVVDACLYSVRPFDASRCPICNGTLRKTPELRCDACNIRIDTARPATPPPYNIEKITGLPAAEFAGELYRVLNDEQEFSRVGTEMEARVAAALEFHHRVLQGGIFHYFDNCSSKDILRARKCFHDMGDTSRLAAIDKAMTILPEGEMNGEPWNLGGILDELAEEPHGILESAGEQYSKLDDDIAPKLKSFVLANLGQFKTPPTHSTTRRASS